MIAPRLPIDPLLDPPETGQIWRQRGAGLRYVRVMESPQSWIRIRSCQMNGDPIKGARATLVAEDQFPKRFIRIYGR
jgi:hypothetical protein